MSTIKQQISDLRKNTPKHIQWLLLAAAFVVVMILLTLLLTSKEKEKIETTESVAIQLKFDPEIIDMSNTMVGTKTTRQVNLSTNAPTKIVEVNFLEQVPGLSINQTCVAKNQIDAKNNCTITLDYQPTSDVSTKIVELVVKWHGAQEPAAMTKSTNQTVVISAQAPKQEPKPEPAPQPEPETETEPETEPVKTVKQEIKQEIKEIAPSDPFIDAAPKTAPETQPVKPAESCSDFAFPGYNLSGVQSGWIRPEAGAYYYHPFSDKNCDSPTGVYNPDTGIITDINDNITKIGTDSEHIGYTNVINREIPQLSNPAPKKEKNLARQLTADELAALPQSADATTETGNIFRITLNDPKTKIYTGSSSKSAVFSSDPFDRKFVLRQYKPIPATIVSEVRADPSLYNCDAAGKCSDQTLPVRATVDRNVYSDDGRTVIIPTGTLLLGYVTGELPGPYKSIGRMQIKWYQFILPNGVEFNFHGNNNPFSGDSQGRAGVPGHGSTDYVEQIVMPMLTAIVPAAVNMIAPIADTFVNQIDLDNNTIVQSGTVRSSELAKNEIITAWNQVAQKLLVDAMDNTVPPFSIAAGTRITVFSPEDLVITCGKDDSKECSVDNVQEAIRLEDKRNLRNDQWNNDVPFVKYGDSSWVGQVRSFNLEQFCKTDSNGIWDIKESKAAEISDAGYDYRTVLAYCQSLNYKAINNAKQDALYQNQQQQFQANYGTGSEFGTGTGLTGISGSQAYNEDILGLTYEDGVIQNPFQDNNSAETLPVETPTNVLTCPDGTIPDEYGCCAGEIYTDMGDQGFNCCPETGGDCFPPIK